MNKNSNGYIPAPVDTSEVVLNEQLQALAERLAENTHDVWALGKMAKGYVYGSETNDQALTHSELKPYAELSESVKDYDRHTSIETIKLLLSMGWSLIPPKD